MNNGSGDGFVPVREGEEIDVKIEAVGEKGDGLAKRDGFVLFVPNTNLGDEVRVRITKVLKKVGFAEVVGKAESPVQASEPEAAPAPEPEPAPADSDDFGEEPAEYQDEEAAEEERREEEEAESDEPEETAEEPEADEPQAEESDEERKE